MMKKLKKMIVTNCVVAVVVFGGAYWLSSVQNSSTSSPDTFEGWQEPKELKEPTSWVEYKITATIKEWWWINPITGEKEKTTTLTIMKEEPVFVEFREASATSVDDENVITFVASPPEGNVSPLGD